MKFEFKKTSFNYPRVPVKEPMKKIEFLNRLMQWCYGPEVNVVASENGQQYDLMRDGEHLRTIWVDNLRGCRVSIKLKYKDTPVGRAMAQSVSDHMMDFLMSNNFIVDAATKSDVYENYSSRGGCWYKVARLRCDRFWN